LRNKDYGIMGIGHISLDIDIEKKHVKDANE
jgi:hypothetical protein